LPYLLVAEFVDFVRYIHLRIPSAGVEIEVNIRLVAAVASVVAVAVVGITATSSIAHSGLGHHSLEQGLAGYIAVAEEAIPCNEVARGPFEAQIGRRGHLTDD